MRLLGGGRLLGGAGAASGPARAAATAPLMQGRRLARRGGARSHRALEQQLEPQTRRQPGLGGEPG
jgi:hypothetical protein